MSAGLLQPINAVLRPHKVKGEAASSRRRAWEVLHKGLGWGAVLLSFPTVGLGASLAGVDAPRFRAAYIAAWALLAAVGLAAARDRHRYRRALGRGPDAAVTGLAQVE